MVDVMGGIRSHTNGPLDERYREHKVADPVSELRREHVEVAEPLLARVAVIADLLDAGANIGPAQIAEAIDLWETYLHGNRWERLSLMADPPVTSCSVAIREARESHERVHQRMARLRTFLEAYSADLPNARGKLVLGLRSGVLVDGAWSCFQERHPFSSLPGKMYAATNRQPPQGLAQVLKRTWALEEKVQQYLARGVAICSNPREDRRGIASDASPFSVPSANVPDEGVLNSHAGNGGITGART